MCILHEIRIQTKIYRLYKQLLQLRKYISYYTPIEIGIFFFFCILRFLIWV